MADKSSLTPGSGVRVIVKFGTVKRKKKTGTGSETYTAYVDVTKRVAEALNLQPVPSKALENTKDGKVYRSGVSKGGKSVKVDNPNKPGYYMSLPVPSNANISQIADFLAPSKASRFSLGGRFWPCTGEEAQAAKDGERAAAAETAKAKGKGKGK